jgi:hypothetical protein
MSKVPVSQPFLALSFRLDLTTRRLYKAATSRQAVSIASVGTEHPIALWSEKGTNLDECRSNAVDHS